MAGRKNPKDFRNAPFRDALKGASASFPAEKPQRKPVPNPDATPPEPAEAEFDREMAALGVQPLGGAERAASDEAATPESAGEPSDRELFLAALGGLDKSSQDDFPEQPAAGSEPRRMRRLHQGKLQPQAQLDLHGQLSGEALVRVGHFLDNARFHQLRCVLIITGRGRHSAEGPVLRTTVEAYLAGPGRDLVAEWARAPRQLGGEGALVVFLRST